MSQSHENAAAQSADPLQSLPLFAGLQESAIALLRMNSVERSFDVGEFLFHAGTRPTGIYLVLSGNVRVTRSREGRQYVVHSEGPGGTLAEIPFFEGGVLPSTAVAAEPTRCLILHRDALIRAMREDPAVAWLFLRRLSARARVLLERLDRVSTQPIPARLAAYLLTRAEATNGTPFTLGITQEQLAQELGTVRELVVRSLARLRDSGVITSEGRGRYGVGDLAALRALAES